MAEPIRVSSEIFRVDLFRAGALVQRRARVDIGAAAGPLEIRLSGLPLSLRDDSLRTRLLPEGTGRLLDLHLGLELGARRGSERTPLQQEVARLRRERTRTRVLLQREEDRVRLLEAMAPARENETEFPERLAFEARDVVGPRLALAELVSRELAMARQRQRQAEKVLLEIEDRLTEARDRLERESSAIVECLEVTRKSVRLTLVPAAGVTGAEIELSYLVPYAGWYPQYELRVARAQDRAELVLQAVAAQQSGEDWPAAQLSFSTADFYRSTVLPEPSSWRIGRAQPLKPSGWRELPEGLDDLFAGYDQGRRLARETYAPPPLPALDLPQMPALIASTEKGENVRSREALALGAVLREEPQPPPKRARAKPRSSPPMPPPEAVPCAAPAPAGFAAPSAKAQAVCRECDDLAPQESAVECERSVLAEETTGEYFAADGQGRREGAAVTLGGDALDYARLVMRGPDESDGRGRLLAFRPEDELAEQVNAVVREDGEDFQPFSHGELHMRLPEEEQTWRPLRGPVPLEVAAGSFAVRYPAESPAAVPGDGQPHRLTLWRREEAIRRVFRCVPAVDERVFALAEFDNPLQMPLLAGAVKVFEEGDFLVDSQVDTTPPGKTILVNLGLEPAIAVARRLKVEEGSAGLLGGTTAIVHHVEIEVRSKRAVPSRVEIFERIPVSDSPEVKVSLLSSEPAAESYDQAERGVLLRGGLRLRLDLAPRQSVTCRLSYRIELPAKQMLVGGNRRD